MLANIKLNERMYLISKIAFGLPRKMPGNDTPSIKNISAKPNY